MGKVISGMRFPTGEFGLGMDKWQDREVHSRPLRELFSLSRVLNDVDEIKDRLPVGVHYFWGCRFESCPSSNRGEAQFGRARNSRKRFSD
jgi:hypothetical protein